MCKYTDKRLFKIGDIVCTSTGRVGRVVKFFGIGRVGVKFRSRKDIFTFHYTKLELLAEPDGCI